MSDWQDETPLSAAWREMDRYLAMITETENLSLRGWLMAAGYSPGDTNYLRQQIEDRHMLTERLDALLLAGREYVTQGRF